jgi:cytoskeletal protein CcmA (bactofilin family)
VLGSRSERLSVPAANDEMLTFLARGFEFKGTLNFDGTVRIDGVVTGDVHTKGTLILGQHAVIEGDVTAGTIVSGGKIAGTVTASEKVELLSTAAVLGTVNTPLLHIEEGVRFQGDCETQGIPVEPAVSKSRQSSQGEGSKT